MLSPKDIFAVSPASSAVERHAQACHLSLDACLVREEGERLPTTVPRRNGMQKKRREKAAGEDEAWNT